jgi:hypothetical protein
MDSLGTDTFPGRLDGFSILDGSRSTQPQIGVDPYLPGLIAVARAVDFHFLQ